MTIGRSIGLYAMYVLTELWQRTRYVFASTASICAIVGNALASQGQPHLALVHDVALAPMCVTWLVIAALVVVDVCDDLRRIRRPDYTRLIDAILSRPHVQRYVSPTINVAAVGLAVSAFYGVVTIVRIMSDNVWMAFAFAAVTALGIAFSADRLKLLRRAVVRNTGQQPRRI